MKTPTVEALSFVYGITKSTREQFDFAHAKSQQQYQSESDAKKRIKSKTDRFVRNMEPDWTMMNRQMEIAQKQSEAEQEKLEILLQCMEIFRRISGGDNVPQVDHEFLLKHDSTLYARAITLRVPKEDPYDYDQLSSDEREETEVMFDVPESHSVEVGMEEPVSVEA